MKVAKSTMRPASTRAHFECVPGRTNSPSARPLALERAEDLRLLAAHHVGRAARVARAEAGNDDDAAEFQRRDVVVAAAISAAPAGQAT